MNQLNRVVGHELVVMHDNGPEPERALGWIRLLGPSGIDAGYVYVTDTPVRPRLGGVGRLPQPYVVMSRPVADLPALLMFLNDGRAKTIRYSDDNPQEPSAFLEHEGGQVDPEFSASL